MKRRIYLIVILIAICNISIVAQTVERDDQKIDNALLRESIKNELQISNIFGCNEIDKLDGVCLRGVLRYVGYKYAGDFEPYVFMGTFGPRRAYILSEGNNNDGYQQWVDSVYNKRPYEVVRPYSCVDMREFMKPNIFPICIEHEILNISSFRVHITGLIPQNGNCSFYDELICMVTFDLGLPILDINSGDDISMAEYLSSLVQIDNGYLFDEDQMLSTTILSECTWRISDNEISLDKKHFNISNKKVITFDNFFGVPSI